MKKICYIILILCFSLVSCAPTENVIDDGTQANTTDLNDYENVLNSLDEEQIGISGMQQVITLKVEKLRLLIFRKIRINAMI